MFSVFFKLHPVPNDMEINKWENNNNEICNCVLLMTDEFKDTETAAISTAELPSPRDSLCLMLIFACKWFFAPAGNAGL